MNRWRKTPINILLGTLALVACGKSGENAGGGAPAAAPAAPAAPAVFPVSADSQATIHGRVAFTGAKPAAARIDMSEEQTCAAKHSSSPATNEDVVVNTNNTLRNVFVYVKSGLPATMTFPVPTEHVTLDQDGCQYKPHVIGVQVGQTIDIKNNDGILHNIKATGTANRPFNISQPTNMTTPRDFSSPEVMVPLQCNVHSWMNGYAGVLNHPYFAVTGEDGSFSIGRLPPGTYVIEAWQGKYPAQTQTVTVGAKENKEITFTFHG